MEMILLGIIIAIIFGLISTKHYVISKRSVKTERIV